MSVHAETFSSLQSMGIDPTLAREAASRYHSVEPAINWCFGDGANWQPEPAPGPTPPTYNWTSSNTTVEHREVADDIDPSLSTLSAHKSPPALPPRVQRNNTPAPYIGTQTPISIDEDDSDEDLRKALALSTAGPGNTAIGIDEDRRQERERSVRAAGAPPPSPDPTEADALGEEGQVMDTLFGPSNKNDEDGKMQMVPASQNTNSLSKEEEDMNRAIQESLMTASFHSASAMQNNDKPMPTVRVPGAPLVFHSQSNQSTYAANLIQAMYAVPQLRDAVLAAAGMDTYTSTKGGLIIDLFSLPSSEPMSFVEVDEPLNELRDGYDRIQLPPNPPTTEFFNSMCREFISLLSSGIDTSSSNGESEELRRRADISRLFNTSIEGENPMESTFVTFNRSKDISNDIYSHLSNILWSQDSPQSTIAEFSDILTVFVKWDMAASRELWKLDERIILDRFLKTNAAYATYKRAQQSLSAGNARRLQERIDHLKLHQGNDYQESLKTPPSGDAMVVESRKEMRAKLNTILGLLESKVKELESELEEVTRAASGSVFETDDPAMLQHVYTLRAVLMHDGALVGQNHLYVYIRGDDARWWKITDHEITSVEWEAIAGDNTGLWMDGGPYALIYSREGARPLPESDFTSEASTGDANDGLLIDLGEVDVKQAESEEDSHKGISKDVDELM